MRALLSDIADLALGRQCLGCAEPGPGICPGCLRGLRGRPVPVRAGVITAYAGGAYDGLLRSAVIAYKEHGYLSLADPLGRLLADAVLASVTWPPGSVVLVPVPAHRASRRGFDPVALLGRHACRHLAARGCPASVSAILVARERYPALKGLGRAEREAAVSGAFAVRRAPPESRRGDAAALVVIDDVVTTGATAREAVRALAAARIAAAARATGGGRPRGRGGPGSR